VAGFQKLDSVSFDELLGTQDPFGTSEPLFDLKGVRLVTPAALVQLVAACHALASTGRMPTVALDDKSVRSYLARAGFVTALQDVARIEPPLPTATYGYLRGTNPMLIEVTKLDRGADLPDLLDRMVWVLRYRLKYRKFDAFDIVTAVSEVSQNTFDHNRNALGFVAMQVYGHGINTFLEIGVADIGDGLAATLRRNPKNPVIASDADAITMATRLGTSEHDDPTRGAGLFHLLEITYKHQGAVQIRSGSAKVRYRMDKRKGWQFNVAHMPGVQIALILPSRLRA
jgi:hypothetical protein